MNQFDYVKVFLYFYPKLEEMEEAVRGSAEIKALLSFRGRGDAISIAETIAEEIVTAKKLSLLRRELDEALSFCSQEELYLLEYKYFRRRAFLEGKFAGYFPDCSERSYFRKQNALLSKIAAQLVRLGWREERFLEEFKDFKPFLRVFRAVREGRERTVVFKRKKRRIVFSKKNVQNSESSCGAETGFFPRRAKTAIAASASPAAQIIAICRAESPDFASGSCVSSPLSTAPEDCR